MTSNLFDCYLMRIILSLIVFFNSLVTFCQEDFNNFINLCPDEGISFPKSVQTYVDVNHVSNSFINKSIKKKDKDFYVKNLINSGYISFGDQLSNYIQTLCNKLISDNKLGDSIDIVLVKSNLASTFNDSKNIIFITTGLIAQTINEEQIVFYIARELSHLQNKHNFNLSQTQDLSLNNLVKILTNYSIDQEINADDAGLKLFSATNFNEGNLKNAIEVFFMANLPFEDLVFDGTYFNRNNFFIPNELILGERNLFLEEYKSQSPKFSVDQEKRIQLLRNQIANYSSTNSSNSIYNFSRNLARFDLLKTDIQANQYIKNLYHIYVLEKDFPNSNYLKLMKVYSWYGILQQKIDNTIYTFDKSIFYHKGESIFFQYFLYRQNIYEIIANTLRTSYDLTIENPSDKTLKLLFDKIIKTIANINYFELSKFHELNFVQTKKLIDQSIDKNKYEKSQESSNHAIILDTVSYYFYCIPDIVKNDDFISKYKAYENKNSEQQNFSSKTINIPFHQFNYYKKNQFDPRKSQFIVNKILQEKDFLNISIKEQNQQPITAKEFNTIGLYKRFFDYIETFRHNQMDVICLDADQLFSNNLTNLSLIPVYEGQYKPHFKGYQILSILFVPIIAITNDFFLNGFKSNYKTLIVDNETGAIAYYSNTKNRLIVNQLDVLNYLYNIRN